MFAGLVFWNLETVVLNVHTIYDMLDIFIYCSICYRLIHALRGSYSLKLKQATWPNKGKYVWDGEYILSA